MFCDGIADYLTDNTDFLVVGVIGLQNSGKSTILNSLAKLSKGEEDLFRVQNYEHQMLGKQYKYNNVDYSSCTESRMQMINFQGSIAPMASIFT